MDLIRTHQSLLILNEKHKKDLIFASIDTENQVIFENLNFTASNFTPLADIFAKQFLEISNQGSELKAFIENFNSQIKQGKYDAKLFYTKRVTKKIEEFNKDIPEHIQAASKLSKSVKKVTYMITEQGAIPQELKPTRPDYNHYIEKQIKIVANTLLKATNQTYDELMNATQLNLFEI